MPRARFFAIAGLPLLAALLMAQPGMAQFNPFQLLAPQPAKPAPAKPTPRAQQKRPAATPAKPTAAPAAAAAPKKPEAKKLEAKKPAPPKYELSDYYKVWDVTATTTRKDIVARFGEPQQAGDRRVSYYFNENLVFFFNSDDTVRAMVVGNSFSAMPPNSIPPEVIDKAFIGRTRDDVLKAFGPATVLSDNYRYLPKSGPYKVQFQCYDFERYVCKQMLVQF